MSPSTWVQSIYLTPSTTQYPPCPVSSLAHRLDGTGRRGRNQQAVWVGVVPPTPDRHVKRGGTREDPLERGVTEGQGMASAIPAAAAATVSIEEAATILGIGR